MSRLVLPVLALLFAPWSATAADFDAKPIDAAIERALTEFQVPGAAVVVVHDDRVVYLKGFGVREQGKADPVTPQTVFPIASCSKAFTATLVAMLVSEGKLKWDDKVRDHLEYFHLSDDLADREVTIRDLLCHRTGMPRHDLLWSGLSTDGGEVIRRWGKAPPSTSFRSKWEYANVPFTAAGVMAGDKLKTSWAGAVEQRIFAPLGMKSSSANWKAGFTAPDRATPHYHKLDRSIAAVAWDELDHAGGAGCVNSTAADMANWLRFQLGAGTFEGKTLLAERTLKETHTAQMLLKPEGPFVLYFPAKAGRFHSYGLGWFVHDYRGFDCVSHGGTLTGFRAQCMMVPEKKLGVFAVCNLRPTVFPEAVCKAVLDRLLSLPPEDWVKIGKDHLALLDISATARIKKRQTNCKPDAKPSLPLAKYAGKYQERAYGLLEVVLENEKLVARWGKFTLRLDHYHFDTFTAVPIEPANEIVSFDRSTFDVQFQLGVNGEVEVVKMFDQEFKRAKP